MHHGCFLSITQLTTLLKLSQCGQLEGDYKTILYVLLMYQPLLYVILNKKGVIYSCTEQLSQSYSGLRIGPLIGMKYEEIKLGM